jgi:DtxR family Mn-dependent transcriptional regulator
LVVRGIVVNNAKNKDLSASLEDYLEAILNLTAEAKVARSKDIAETLGVSRASVTGALRALKQKDLANYEPYGYVTLTDQGLKAAKDVAQKHKILKSFFVNILGIQADAAQKAACAAEHKLEPNIIAHLLNFSEFVTKENANGYDLAKKFKKYCRAKNKKR